MLNINPLSFVSSKRRGRETHMKHLDKISEIVQGDFFEANHRLFLEETRLPFEKPVLEVEKGAPMLMLSPTRPADALDNRAFVCEIKNNVYGWIDLWTIEEDGTVVPQVRDIKRSEKFVADYRKDVLLPMGQFLGNTMRKGTRCTAIMPIELRQSYEEDSTVLLSAPIGEHLEILHAVSDSVFAVSLTRRKTVGWMQYRSKSGMPYLRAISNEDELRCLGIVGLKQRLFENAVCVVTRGPLQMLYHKNGEVAAETLHKNSMFTFIRFMSNDVVKMKDNFGVVGWMVITDKAGNLAIKIDFEAQSFTMLTAKEELLISAKGGNFDTLLAAYEAEGSIQAVDTQGRSPLFYAVAQGHIRCANYILNLPDERAFAVDNCRRQPLHYASLAFPSQDLVALLLERSAKVDHQDVDGRTALSFFATGQDIYAVESLLTAGASINVMCKAGWTPCDYALAAKNRAMASYLCDMGGWSNKHKSVPASIDIEPWNAQMEPALQMNLSDELVELEECLQAALDNPNPKLLDYVFYIAQTCKVDMHRIRRFPAKEMPPNDARPAAQIAQTPDSRESIEVEMPKHVAQLQQALEAQDADTREESRDDAVLEELNSLSMLTPIPLIKFHDLLQEVDTLGLEHESVPRFRRVFENERAKLEESLIKAIKLEDCEGIEEVLPTCDYVGVDVSVAVAELERLPKKHALQEKIEAMIANSEFCMPTYKEELAMFATVATPTDEPIFARFRAYLHEQELRAQRKIIIRNLTQARTKEELASAILEAQESEFDDNETLAPFIDLLTYLEPVERCAQKLEAELKLDVDNMRLDKVTHWKNALIFYQENPEMARDAEEILAKEGPRFFAKQRLKKCGQADPATADAFVRMLDGALADAKKVDVPAEFMEPYEEQLKEATFYLPLRRARLAASTYQDVTNLAALETGRTAISTAILFSQEQEISDEELAQFILHRRRIHNRLEDLKGRIRIYARIRPNDTKDVPICVPKGEMGVSVASLDGDEKTIDFNFDACFAPGEQSAIFADVADLLQSVCDGYRCAVFAYGQTGSGKTHTLFGSDADPGITRRTGAHLFKVIHEMRDTHRFEVFGSIYEVYRKRVGDLLLDSTIKAKEVIVGYDERASKVTIEGLTERVLNDADDVNCIIGDGMKIRKVAATAMNLESSRSHLILQLRVVNYCLGTNERCEGKIVLIDLAGSERIKKSGASSKALDEAVDINVSLTALGDVIQAVTDNQKNIPYRHHVLTKIMRDAIGGTAKTLMFVNVSPVAENHEETLQSLRWAIRAKKVTEDTEESLKLIGKNSAPRVRRT